MDGVEAHAAERGEIFLEEAYEASAEACGLIALHLAVSSIKSPKLFSNRSLARATKAGTKCR
jgi:hypothetical protein